jgi:hypothetical protein
MSAEIGGRIATAKSDKEWCGGRIVEARKTVGSEGRGWDALAAKRPPQLEVHARATLDQ